MTFTVHFLGGRGRAGAAGSIIYSGASNPLSSLGVDGDYYLNLTSKRLFGPKTNGAWGSGFALQGTNGKTILYGEGAPSNTLGTDGDFYVNTLGPTWYGPKLDGAWPAGIFIGGGGVTGNIILTGNGAPDNSLGSNGDFYYAKDTKFWYGPKAAGAWPSGFKIEGDDGTDGNTVLNGAGTPGSGLGVNGDFYLDTTNKLFYGPKTAGAWGSGFSIVGDITPELQTLHDETEVFRDAAEGFKDDAFDAKTDAETAQAAAETAQTAAEGFADDAASSANDASNSAALTAADAVATAADRVQTGIDRAAADASATLAGSYASAAALSVTSIYADTTAGLAASSDGQYFYTLSSTPYVFLDLYQEVSGSAILKDSIANKDAFDAVLNIATEITVSGSDDQVTIKGVTFVDADDTYIAGWSYPFFDQDWRLLGGILTDGEWQWGGGHKTFSYSETDWRSAALYPVIDAAGYWLSWYDAFSGRFNAILSAETIRKSNELADIDPQTLIDLGARGMPYEARRGPGKFFKFKSTCAVGPLLMRSNLASRATMYNTTDTIPVHVGYGQSWRQQGTRPLAEMILNPDSENEAVVTLCVVHNDGSSDPIASSAGINYPTGVADLCGISLDLGVNIDRVAMIARHRLRLRGRKPIGPMLFWTGGYPGSSLFVGGDDGLGLGPTGNVWARNVEAMADATEQIARWPNDLVYGDNSFKAVGSKSLGWTQGGHNGTAQENADALTDVLIPMVSSIGITRIYMGVYGGRSAVLDWTAGTQGQIIFLETYDNDNPTLGVKVYETCPWYMLQFGPADPIHFGDAGIVIYGEIEGAVRYWVEDCGIDYKGCHITDVPGADKITVSGQAVTVWIDRPNPPEFGNSPLVADTTLSPEVPFYGFRAKLDGTPLTLTGDVTLSTGTQVGIDDVEFLTATFNVVEDLSGGGTLTVNYAIKGDAPNADGTWTPTRGNLLCPGPLSVVRKDRPNATIDIPLRQFEKEITL